MTALSDRFRGHSPPSSGSGGEPSGGAVEDGEVDRAAASAFEDRLVSKPRARRFASQYSVPHHFAELLLSRYKAEGCTGTEAARRARKLLSDRLARAEDIELLKMKASTEGSVQVIDEVEGEFDERLGRARAQLLAARPRERAGAQGDRRGSPAASEKRLLRKY